MDKALTLYLKMTVFAAVVLLVGCGESKSESGNSRNEKSMQEKKYKWRPSECATEHYAVEIYHGSVIADGKYYSIPDNRTVNRPWGTFGTMWAVGDPFKTVPDSVKVIWLSFTEDQFYFLDAKLPKQKMAALFEKGFVNDDGREDNFDEVLVGLAPGGAVSVWLLSATYVVEVGHYQGKKTDVSMAEFNPDGMQDRSEYIKSVEKSYSDETKKILETQEIPFGKWTAFRQRFYWQPIIKHEEPFELDRLYLDFYNGENYIVSDKNPDLIDSHYFPPANKIAFYWFDKNKNRYGCRIYFDEEEIWGIYNAFFEENGEPAELVLTIDEFNSDISIFLERDDQRVEIKKAKINMFVANL